MSDVNTHRFPHGDILVVDDTRSDLKYLSGILRQAGYKVRPASDGELALRSVQARLPALILLDINMPGLDGYEVCRRLKDAKDTRDIPVIFISARTSPLDKVKAFGLGGVDYISKPFEPEEVLAHVATHLALWRAQKEIEERNLQLQQEITERKQAEKVLHLEKERAERYLNIAPSIILALDTNGAITLLNEAGAAILECDQSEVTGKNWFDTFFPERVQDSVKEIFQTLMSGELTSIEFVEEVVLTAKGNEKTILWHNSLLYDEEDNIIGTFSSGEDITERKRAEETLRQSERELGVRNQINIIFLTYPDEKMYTEALKVIQEVMESEFGTFGYFDENGSFVAPAVSREIYWERCNVPEKDIIFQKGTFSGIWSRAIKERKTLISNDGPFNTPKGHIPISNTMVTPIIFHDEVISAIHVANKHNGYDEKDRGMLETIANQIAPVLYARLQRDKQDKERKRAEEELQRFYEQAQRDAETKAMLLREVNHRVKNNLTTILGMLYAERSHAEVADQPMYRAITQSLMNRVSGLATVHSLLSASEWAPLLLSDLAGQVIRSSLQMLPRGKSVPVEVTPSSVRVTPDQAHNLALVINELATNTIKHALQERDTAHITVHIALEDDDTVQFEFRDDGPGYPEDVLRLERYSVGFDLIQNIVRRNLRGELSLRTDDGAVAVIRLSPGIREYGE